MRLLTVLVTIFWLGRLSADDPSKYVSVYGFYKSCDVTFKNSMFPWDYIQPDNLKPGDVIWLLSINVPRFYRDVLPRIHTPFVLVIHWGDESFPTSHKNEIDVEDFIANKNILHIFAQNCDYTGPQKHKVSPIPIGIDIHTLSRGSGAFHETKHSPQEQEYILDQVLKQLQPTNKRIRKALVDFHLNDTIANPGWPSVNRYLDPGETRTTIAQRIANSRVVDFMQNRIKRREFWKLKGRYAFSICPPGNGLDTHRAWEDLILGCIVIVHTSPMDRLYEGLPVVIIKDWSEINPKNFDKWIQMYGDAFTNPKYRERITLAYWINKIRNF